MMNFTSLPFLDILQSVYVCPPSSQISIALNLKVILGKEADPHPFFGIWVLDLSSSMLDDRKIDAAIASLKEQINFLPEGTIFSLITFGNPVEALVNKMEINSSNRKALFWTIDNLVPRGSTPFREALDKTFEILKSYYGNLPKKIIIMSDGQPDWGCSSEDVNESRFLRYMEYAHLTKEFGASMDSIGIGIEHNVLLMYQLAVQSTGKYIFAPTAEELKQKTIVLTKQATNILHPDPVLYIEPNLGSCKIYDAIQHRPTLIRYPFEKIGDNWKTFLRPFETAEEIEFMLKIDYKLPDNAHNILSSTKKFDILKFTLDLGQGRGIEKNIQIQFSNNPGDIRLNRGMLKQYNLLTGQVNEISELTIRGDASKTQMVQGDETKKW